ncbi:MAG: extracellular solute-binding protein [Gaiella sp.]
MRSRRIGAALATLVAFLAVVGAASTSTTTAAATSLTVYSGREESLVKPLLERFTKETGIELKVRYGSSLSLSTTIIEEGTASPADVFWATEPGTLGLLAGRGLLRRLPSATVDKVPSRFATPSRRWVGTSGRSRVIAYNTQLLTPAQLPKSIWGLTDPRWKGKVGLPPTNASFQSFLGAMLYLHGEDRTRDWLRGLKENGVRFYARNSAVVEAVSRGEVELGLVNHYYVYNHLAQSPNAPVRNHWLRKADPGALVLVAGVGVVSSSKNQAAAQRFVDFLLSRWAQRFIARGPGAAEYPLIKGILPRPGLPPLKEIEGPKYNLGRLAVDLPEAVKLLLEVGYIK